jgi:hypothetical protein
VVLALLEAVVDLAEAMEAGTALTEMARRSIEAVGVAEATEGMENINLTRATNIITKAKGLLPESSGKKMEHYILAVAVVAVDMVRWKKRMALEATEVAVEEPHIHLMPLVELRILAAAVAEVITAVLRHPNTTALPALAVPASWSFVIIAGTNNGHLAWEGC